MPSLVVKLMPKAEHGSSNRSPKNCILSAQNIVIFHIYEKKFPRINFQRESELVYLFSSLLFYINRLHNMIVFSYCLSKKTLFFEIFFAVYGQYFAHLCYASLLDVWSIIKLIRHCSLLYPSLRDISYNHKASRIQME